MFLLRGTILRPSSPRILPKETSRKSVPGAPPLRGVFFFFFFTFSRALDYARAVELSLFWAEFSPSQFSFLFQSVSLAWRALCHFDAMCMCARFRCRLFGRPSSPRVPLSPVVTAAAAVPRRMSEPVLAPPPPPPPSPPPLALLRPAITGTPAGVRRAQGGAVLAVRPNPPPRPREQALRVKPARLRGTAR